ncbi:MAG: S-layer homology domain-containing protein [Thermoanaerobaculia bacterium]
MKITLAADVPMRTERCVRGRGVGWLAGALLGLSHAGLAATITVTSTADSGAGSLRQAILDSNASAGVLDTIAFAIGSGVQTITPLSALPIVTDPVVIDGTTQPGYAGTPIIELAGGGLAATGLEIAAGNSTVRALVIHGFNRGIWLKSDGNTVEGSFIGTDTTGTQGLGNGTGVWISSSSGNTIGGSTPAARNLVSASTNIGILMDQAPDTVVAGNFIGTDITGTVDLGNQGSAGGYAGVSIQISDDVLIGGTAGTTPGGPCTGACNLISGNDGNGITIYLAAARVLVQGNFIGVDAGGTTGLGNSFYGVEVGAGSTNAVIGGTSPAARNVISGSALGGIFLGLGGNSSGHVVSGNYIGTDATGAATIPSGGYGVLVASSPGMTIGGSAAGAGNLISGHTQSGVTLNSGGNVVQGNRIGTDASGALPLPNGDFGVDIQGSGNTIGGTAAGAGNVIAFHKRDGIYVWNNATGNAIRGNAVFSNGSLGIELIPPLGPTPNDPNDGDTGANERQNFPIISSVTTLGPAGSGTRIQGLLHSAPSTTYELDFFENPGCANFAREFVEGQTYLGSGQVSTDGTGTGVFDVTVPVAVAPGARISATATDPSGNTSEFSQRIIFSMAPASGLSSGGTSVTLSGTDFSPGATVSIGPASATNVTVGSFVQITATTPALAAGAAYDVVVANADGSAGTLAKGWVSDFLDVPQGQLFHSFVTTLVSNAITAGVGGGLYGVNDNTLRQQMAVFLLKAKHGLCYSPPGCTGVFGDVPCPSTFADWIEALAAEGITGGCGGGNYCPQNPVRRDQMAVFLLKAEHGSAYAPPSCTGVFADVPCPGVFADWIEQLAAELITGGCGGGNYCPLNPNTRGQMAVFIVKTFGLQ